MLQTTAKSARDELGHIGNSSQYQSIVPKIANATLAA